MRRRRLTCARRKEQSDGIAIATKSIASSSLPVGLCRRQKGETREEGGHILSRDYALRQIARFYRTLYMRWVLIQALTPSKTEFGGAAATCNSDCYEVNRAPKRVPSTRICTKLRVRSVFLHQRNEWHNEATLTYVRAPSVALPVGLCRMANGGNT